MLTKKKNLKLRTLMAENGITQSRLAEKLKMGASTLSRKLNGTAPWYYHECMLVSKFFGKSVVEVFPAIDDLPDCSALGADPDGCSLAGETAGEYEKFGGVKGEKHER